MLKYKLSFEGCVNEVSANTPKSKIYLSMFFLNSYRLNFEKLKNLKTQIEHSQLLIEKSQVKLQKDFENWWQEQCEIIVAFKNILFRHLSTQKVVTFYKPIGSKAD